MIMCAKARKTRTSLMALRPLVIPTEMKAKSHLPPILQTNIKKRRKLPSNKMAIDLCANLRYMHAHSCNSSIGTTYIFKSY